MENASKALLIAAGILIGLILITMIIFGYNQISSYYTNREEVKQSEQLAEFNKQYIGYDREDVRGSDLLSLVNKIIDYNAPRINDVNEEKIEISIIIPNINTNDESKLFFYKYDEYYRTGAKTALIKFGESNKYTQDNIYNNNGLIAEANKIESKYTQALATKLASKMSTLMGENSRQTPEELFEELKIDPLDYGSTLDLAITNIQNDILKYYQYQQFKRAHFDCQDLTYKDGRVKSFKFVFNGTFE